MDGAETSFSESLLLARGNRDPDMRAQLLEGYRPFLKRLASQLIGAKYSSRLDVSDLVQSAVIGALNDFSKCRAANEAEFKAWLRRLLVNDIMNKVRFLNQAKRDIGRETPVTDLGKIADRQLTPVSKVAKEEDERRLMEAMKKLADQDQQVIRHRNQEKLRFSEIGKIMNRSEDSARMLWTRAIQKLAKLLQPDD